MRPTVRLLAMAVSVVLGIGAGLALSTTPTHAQEAGPPAPRRMSQEQLDKMVPKHEGFYGALALQNLAIKRPKPPFDLTGTWFVDLSEGFNKFMFGPPYPQFLAAGQEAMREGAKARAEGRSYRDSIGACFPPGMPMIMTRVWSIAMIQLPTAVYMIAGFDNSVRFIYLDGRKFTDPDIAISTYNGESVGRWEGDTLVVHSKYFETKDHWIDTGLPVSDQFEMTERIKMLKGGKTLEIEYIMTDPKNWVGEWRNVKRFRRQDYSDINEVECLPDLNDHLPSTGQGRAALEERGHADAKPKN